MYNFEMKNLEHFYSTHIGVKFSDRKLKVDGDRALIIGGLNTGKSYLLLDSLRGFKKGEILYLNFEDLRFSFDKNALTKFLNSNKNIKALGLDSVSNSIDLEFLNELKLDKIVVSTCHNSTKIKGFKTLKLYPLDFEEFLAIDKKSIDLGASMSAFLSAGNGAKNSFLAPENRALALQESLKTTLNESEILVLKECADFKERNFSSFAIFRSLKARYKISKDSVYSVISGLEDRNFIHFLDKFESSSKELFFNDFSLTDALSLNKNFSKRLKNALFCELLKLDESKFYTDEIDIFIPSKKLGFITIPFTPLELINLKFRSLLKELKKLKISKLIIITMGASGEFSYEGVECFVMPFWEFALGFDYE